MRHKRLKKRIALLISTEDLAKLRQLETAYDVPVSSVIRTLIRQATVPVWFGGVRVPR
jgi:hypothetical protein